VTARHVLWGSCVWIAGFVRHLAREAQRAVAIPAQQRGRTGSESAALPLLAEEAMSRFPLHLDWFAGQ
jgi:hypothetical protein